MVTAEELTRLKSSIERKREEASRLKGEAAAHRRRLKDEFGCKDLKAAKVKLAKLEKQEKALTGKLETQTEKVRGMLE